MKVKDVPQPTTPACPGYLRGKPGMVETVYEGAFAYFCSTGPDGMGSLCRSYCVRFDPATSGAIWPSPEQRHLRRSVRGLPLPAA